MALEKGPPSSQRLEAPAETPGPGRVRGLTPAIRPVLYVQDWMNVRGPSSDRDDPRRADRVRRGDAQGDLGSGPTPDPRDDDRGPTRSVDRQAPRDGARLR